MPSAHQLTWGLVFRCGRQPICSQISDKTARYFCAGKMVNGRKRSRSLNWSHEETMLLAELKREAFLNTEGGLVWQRIAQTISSRFPNKTRSDDQCRRRWDTLRKDYNHIEEYCIETGQDHWQLEEEELASMKLDTAYRQDWYDIVRQVCSQRKRKEGGDRDLIVAKQSKRSETDSHSAVFPEPTPGRVTLCATPPASTSEPVITTRDTHHEQATTVNAQICTRSSLESVEKLSAQEEILRLKREKNVLVLELAQMRRHVQLTEQNQPSEPTHQVLQTFPEEPRAQVKEPLQEGVLDCEDVAVDSSSKVAQGGAGSELMVSPSRSLSPECSSHGQQHLGAMNIAGGKGSDFFDIFASPLAMGCQNHFDSSARFSEVRLEPGRSFFSKRIAPRTNFTKPKRVLGWEQSGVSNVLESLRQFLSLEDEEESPFLFDFGSPPFGSSSQRSDGARTAGAVSFDGNDEASSVSSQSRCRGLDKLTSILKKKFGDSCTEAVRLKMRPLVKELNVDDFLCVDNPQEQPSTWMRSVESSAMATEPETKTSKLSASRRPVLPPLSIPARQRSTRALPGEES